MTGFGRAIVEFAGTDLSVEVKSVNNRYLKTSMRLPDLLSPHEATLESVVRGTIRRGSVNISVRYGDSRTGYRYSLNAEVASDYYAQLQAISSELGLEGPTSVRDVVSLPGVVESQEVQSFDDSKFLAAARQALGKALEACNTMRDAEGKSLVNDLEMRCKLLLGFNEEVKKYAPQVVESYQQKLKDRVDRLLKSSKLELREEDLVREVALFADRSDVSEETQRLAHHCESMLELIHKKGEAGRKLDFIAQEMLREANTIGSKANDAGIASLVVSIKAEIEKIKEQVQNVE